MIGKAIIRPLVFLPLAVLAALSMSVSCSDVPDDSKSEAQQQRATDLFVFIPEGDFFIFGYSDIASLIKSDVAQKILHISQPLKLWNEKLGVDINKYQSMSFAIGLPESSDSDPSVIVIMSGEIAESEILELLGDKSYFFNKTEVGGRTFYESGEDFGFSFPADKVVALGTPSLVRKAMEVTRDDKSEELALKRLRPFEDILSSSSDDLWVGISDIDEIVRDQTSLPIPGNLRKMKRFYMGIDFTEDINIRLLVSYKSEEDAARMARGFTGAIGVLNFMIGNLGDEDFSEFEMGPDIDLKEMKTYLLSMLDTIEVDHRKQTVEVKFVIPQQIIDFFLDMARDVVRMAPAPDSLGDTNHELDARHPGEGRW